jgi:hypothetical protein
MAGIVIACLFEFDHLVFPGGDQPIQQALKLSLIHRFCYLLDLWQGGFSSVSTG